MAESAALESMWAWSNKLFAVSAAKGALPTLYAATAPNVHGGEYIGPKLVGGGRGGPAVVRCNVRARDVQTAARLWRVSEKMTGVRYPI